MPNSCQKCQIIVATQTNCVRVSVHVYVHESLNFYSSRIVISISAMLQELLNLNLVPSECSVVANKPIGLQIYRAYYQVTTTTPLLYTVYAYSLCMACGATDRKQFHIIIPSLQLAFMETAANGAVRFSHGLRLI